MARDSGSGDAGGPRSLDFRACGRSVLGCVVEDMLQPSSTTATSTSVGLIGTCVEVCSRV